MVTSFSSPIRPPNPPSSWQQPLLPSASIVPPPLNQHSLSVTQDRPSPESNKPLPPEWTTVVLSSSGGPSRYRSSCPRARLRLRGGGGGSISGSAVALSLLGPHPAAGCWCRERRPRCSRSVVVVVVAVNTLTFVNFFLIRARRGTLPQRCSEGRWLPSPGGWRGDCDEGEAEATTCLVNRWRVAALLNFLCMQISWVLGKIIAFFGWTIV